MELNRKEFLKKNAMEAVGKYYDMLFDQLDKKRKTRVIYRTEGGNETTFLYDEFALPFVIMNEVKVINGLIDETIKGDEESIKIDRKSLYSIEIVIDKGE